MSGEEAIHNGETDMLSDIGETYMYVVRIKGRRVVEAGNLEIRRSCM